MPAKTGIDRCTTRSRACGSPGCLFLVEQLRGVFVQILLIGQFWIPWTLRSTKMPGDNQSEHYLINYS